MAAGDNGAVIAYVVLNAVEARSQERENVTTQRPEMVGKLVLA